MLPSHAHPVRLPHRGCKYGLTLYTAEEPALETYLRDVLSQLHTWLVSKTVQKLIVAVTSVRTGDVLERWQFDIQCDKSVGTPETCGAKIATQVHTAKLTLPRRASPSAAPSQKDRKVIRREIQDILRQVSSSVSWLPLLEEPCAFDLLVYTDHDLAVPAAWEESGPKHIIGGQEVLQLRSFSTNIHTVNAAVVYRAEE